MAHYRISEADYEKLSSIQRLARGHAVENGTAWNARSTWGNTEFSRRVAVTADPAKAKAKTAPKRKP